MKHFVPTAPAIKHHFSSVVIPNDWDTVHLEDLPASDAPICYGILMPGADIPNGIPVVKVKDYAGGNIDPDKVQRTKPEIDEQYRRSRIRTGDILLSIRGGTGDLAIVPEELDGANITQDTARIRIADLQSRVFLYHAISGDFVQRQIDLDTVGQAVTGINLASVRQLIIPMPPQRERGRIGEVISTCDDAIEKTGDLIKAKKRQKKALMQQLLTGKKRLPGFEGEWKTFRLGDLFTERAETNCAHLPLLAITGTRGIIPAADIDRKDSSSADKSRYKAIYPGDIGYNTMRMWQGVSAVSQLEGIVSPAYTICIPTNRVDVGFMGYFFKFPPVIYLFWRFSQGLVNDTLNLKYPNFAVIHVTIPDKAEQRAIAEVLEGADEEIAALKNKQSALQQQKKALMQKLLTGQVRVKV